MEMHAETEYPRGVHITNAGRYHLREVQARN